MSFFRFGNQDDCCCPPPRCPQPRCPGMREPIPIALVGLDGAMGPEGPRGFTGPTGPAGAAGDMRAVYREYLADGALTANGANIPLTRVAGSAEGFTETLDTVTVTAPGAYLVTYAFRTQDAEASRVVPIVGGAARAGGSIVTGQNISGASSFTVTVVRPVTIAFRLETASASQAPVGNVTIVKIGI